ncbi:MAG TPA: dienelactone hydrolase family protein, partial [Casimicrobiaceae bacterium]|nr:dienelactone hydrolase family protein [Casimicrobiaceae bacterium]
LIQSADVDERINASWPGYETALKAANVKYERFQYPGTQHGFNNDTTPRYNEAAAKLAWDRTVAFFNKTLRA